VVGDEDERAPGVRVAGFGGHVPGRAAGQRGAAECAGPVVEVVPEGGRRGRGERAVRAPAAQHPRAGDGARGAQQPERPPVAAVDALLLDARVQAGLAQALGDPLRGLALALRGRGTLDGREVADVRLDLGALGGHGGGEP
jgi:hypothetical protein